MSKKEATNSYKSFSTIAPYFGIKTSDYWHVDYQIVPNNDFDYYWNLEEKYIGFDGEYDESGIPLYKGIDGKKHYSVIFLGHYALGAFQHFKQTKTIKSKDDFLLICDFLVDNLTIFKDCDGLWVNTYPMKLYGLKSDWVSGLSQAKGVSCLVRAYYLTQDLKYLSAAIRASNAFFIEAACGGVCVRGNNLEIFEEYPTDSPSMVLNGHIFAIFALNDLVRIHEIQDISSNNIKKIKDKLYSSMLELSRNLHLWENKRWSKYDCWAKHDHIASLFYHDLHIKQFFILYQISSLPEFLETGLKWKEYRDNPFNRLKALFYKVFFRLAGRL